MLSVSIAACSSLHRGPKSAAGKPEPDVPLFTSRNGPPTTFVNSNSDAKTTRIIVVREGLSNEALFRIANDYLRSKYSVYVSDPSAGFLMTRWQSSLTRNGVPELRYRTRIIVSFLGDDWKRLSVNAEANWLHGEEWRVGYDSALLDSVSTQLAARLGTRA